MVVLVVEAVQYAMQAAMQAQGPHMNPGRARAWALAHMQLPLQWPLPTTSAMRSLPPFYMLVRAPCACSTRLRTAQVRRDYHVGVKTLMQTQGDRTQLGMAGGNDALVILCKCKSR